MGLLFQIQDESVKAPTDVIDLNDNYKEVEAKPSPSLNSPLLFFLGELSGETEHAFCDPITHAVTLVEFPELSSQLECLAAAHGWLLLISREESSLFFFNPLTRHRINLPYRSCVFNAAAFSAPPTSPSCTVFAVERDSFNGKFNIDVLRVGKDNFWTRFANPVGSSVFGRVIQVLYSKETLYCVDLEGRISAFDMKKSKWEVLSEEKFKEVGGAFLVELNGEILGVKKGSHGIIEKLFKVKKGDGFAYWEEVKDISDWTLFIGPHGAFGLSGFRENIKKRIYVAGLYGPEAMFVQFKVDGGECRVAVESYIFTFNCWSHTPVWI